MGVQQFVSIAPWTIIFQICNLLLLVFLMKKFLFKPVQNILNKRRQEIDGIYAAANADRSSAAEMKEEYSRKMSGAREEADRLMRGAVEDANRRGEAIVDDARRQADNLKRKAEDEIALQRAKAYQELKKDITGMAVEIAGKMVGRAIREDDQAALVDDFIRNVGDDQ